MKLHPFVIVFALIWLSLVGSFGVSVIYSILEKGIFESIGLLPLGMIIFFYALVIGGFKYESNKSKKYLAELFEADQRPS